MRPESTDEKNQRHGDTEMLLTPQQKKIASIRNGQHLVNAGPGSGKTSTLISRTVDLLREKKEPNRILVVTFSKSAANAFQARLLASGAPDAGLVTVKTLHAWGLHVLRSEKLCGGKVVDDREAIQTLRQIFRDLDVEETEVGLHPHTPRTVLQRIGACKSRALLPSAGIQAFHGLVDFRDLQIYTEYDDRTWRSSRPDFDDLVLRTYLLFRNDHEALGRWVDRYDHIMVDESQDTDVQQMDILQRMGHKVESFVLVGHDSQSIYRFRNAEPKLFIDFSRRDDVQLHGITINFRSTAQIVDICERLITCNRQRIDTPMRPVKKKGSVPLIFVGADPYSQAGLVTQEIQKELKAGIPLEQIAVLYRVRRCSAAVARALALADVPYVIVGGGSWWEMNHIRATLDYCRVLANEAGSATWTESLNRVYWQPRRGLGKAWFQQLRQKRWDLQAMLSMSQWYNGSRQLYYDLVRAGKCEQPCDTINYLLHEMTGFGGITLATYLSAHAGIVGGDDSPLIEDWAQLLGIARRFDTLKAFLQHADDALAATKKKRSKGKNRHNKETPKTVTLRTIHSAKGTEYSSVHLTDMNENVLPHFYALDEDRRKGTAVKTQAVSEAEQDEEDFSTVLEDDPDLLNPGVVVSDEIEENLEEERRLAYVAMSRAAEHLRLYFSLQDWRGLPLRPSRFFKEAGLILPAVGYDDAVDGDDERRETET